MKVAEMIVHKCETCGKELSESTHLYTYPVPDETGKEIQVWACDAHASGFGFCYGCGCFVLGSDDDRTLNRTGLCAQCLDELDDEADYPEDDYWDF